MATTKKGGAKKKAAGKKTSARKSSARKSPARTSAARTSAAKKGAATRRTAKKATARKAASRKAPARKAARKKSTRAPNPAFMRPMQPDEALSAVVGSKPVPRTEITKRVWAYIKKHGLQDAKQRRMINADDTLRPLFNGKRQVSMFEMTSLINGHIRPAA